MLIFRVFKFFQFSRLRKVATLLMVAVTCSVELVPLI